MATALVCSAAALESAAPIRANGTIAYSAAGRIWILGPGGQAKAIARGDSPAWSPDGREIVFESARIAGDGQDLYIMDANGAYQHRVVTHPAAGLPNDTRDDFEPAWSPTDSVIAFTTNRSGTNDIWLTNSIGHATDPLVATSADEHSAAWS